MGRVRLGLRRLLCGAQFRLCWGGLVCAGARQWRRRIEVIAGRSFRCCTKRCWLVVVVEWRVERVVSLDRAVACAEMDLWARSRSFRGAALEPVVGGMLIVDLDLDLDFDFDLDPDLDLGLDSGLDSGHGLLVNLAAWRRKPVCTS